MRTVRILPLAGFAILIFFTSCKKSSSDPSPNPGDTTTQTSCPPTQVIDESTSKVVRRYEYNLNGTIHLAAGMLNPIYSGIADTAHAIITYNGDGTTDLVSSTFSNASAKHITYVGGKIAQIDYGTTLTGLYYKTTYDYLASGNVRITDYNAFDTAMSEVAFENGLPKTQTYFSRNGTPTDHDTYAYGQTVSYNPTNPFTIVPGIDAIKMSKVLSQITFTSDTGSAPPYSISFNSVIVNGRVNTLTLTGFNVGSFRYVYPCN